MKNLILLITLITQTNVFASTFGYAPCEEADLTLLAASHALENPAMNQMLNETIIPTQTKCEVSKPRFMHPAVCGARVVLIDSYKIETEKAQYKIVIDHSYNQCTRERRYVQIKELSYKAR